MRAYLGGPQRIRSRGPAGPRFLQEQAAAPHDEKPVGGSILAGIRLTWQVISLRGIAILAVILLHLTSALTVAPESLSARLLKQAGSFGWSGVDLFFVLSGFLITGILADTRDAPRRFRTFYARRALRILPLYYGFLLLLFAVPALLGARAYVTPLDQQLPYWLYLQNIWWLRTEALAFSAHLWTLAIEEQFYLAWPLLIFTLSPRNALRACAALLLGTLAYRVAAVLTGADLHAVYFQTPARLDGLALGGAIKAALAAGTLARHSSTAPAVVMTTGQIRRPLPGAAPSSCRSGDPAARRTIRSCA